MFIKIFLSYGQCQWQCGLLRTNLVSYFIYVVIKHLIGWWLRSLASFAVNHFRATSMYTWTRSLPVSTSHFIPRKNVSCDLDMCRLAECFPFSALLPQLMNWKPHFCHLSLSPSLMSTLLPHGLDTEHILASNTWEDKCSVKLNKHNPDMLRSSLSVKENLCRDAWFHQWRRHTQKKIICQLKGHC